MLRAAKPAEDKIRVVEELEKTMNEAKSILMADFKGMPVSMLDNLRRKCFESGIQFRVAKNRLAKLVMNKFDQAGLTDILAGPTGFCIGFDDPIVPIRVISDFVKENELPVIKACLIEGELYGSDRIGELRDIPPRQILLGLVVGTIAAPLSNFVYTINEIMRSFIGTIESIARKIDETGDQPEGIGANGGSVENIIEAIEKMTVLELVEFKKALEERFDVTAAAPMAMAGMMPAAGGAAKEEVEEQTEFTVILTAAGDKKIQVIKEVRAITGLGLKEAKALVDEAPKPVKEDIPKDEALAIQAKIEEVGGQVEVK